MTRVGRACLGKNIYAYHSVSTLQTGADGVAYPVTSPSSSTPANSTDTPPAARAHPAVIQPHTQSLSTARQVQFPIFIAMSTVPICALLVGLLSTTRPMPVWKYPADGKLPVGWFGSNKYVTAPFPCLFLCFHPGVCRRSPPDTDTPSVPAYCLLQKWLREPISDAGQCGSPLLILKDLFRRHD